MKLLANILIILFLIPFSVPAQQIWITQDQKLEFGEFIISPGSDAGIRVPANGARSVLNGAYLLPGNYHPAAFTISTDSPTPLKLKIVTATIDMQNELGENIKMDSQEVFPDKLEVSRAFPVQVFVGGVLNIAGTTSSGDYKGNVSIKVAVIENY